MAEIPTMACPACSHLPFEEPHGFGASAGCLTCDGTGRIPRRPLTPDEIAALPDGARVVWLPAGSDTYMAREGEIVREHIGGNPGVNTWFGSGTERATVLLCDQDSVWLAEEPA